jgi:predicted porin
MNKKLMALAVAGACVAPTAMAQTANPVTLYGRVYVMVENVKADGLPSRTRVTDGSSLIGVRGTEDLGGGLKAFFQLETAFETGNSAGNTYATRNSGVGLQGGWGSFMAGRWDSPYKSATIAIDPFGDLTIAGITSALNDRGNHDRRVQNVVQYWSPNMGGFAFRLAHGVNENKTATADPQETAVSITYGKGPVYAFAAYEELKDIGTFAKQKATAAGGAFTFGPVKIGAEYQEYKKTNLTTQKAYMANAVYTAGKHQIMAQFQNAKDGGASGAANQPECDVSSVGYQYNFSKRTMFIALYSEVDNSNGSNCRFGAGDIGAAGTDKEGFAAGIRHTF